MDLIIAHWVSVTAAGIFGGDHRGDETAWRLSAMARQTQKNQVHFKWTMFRY